MTYTACPLCRRRPPQDVGACEPCRAHLARQFAVIPHLLDAVWEDAEAAMDGTDTPDADPINWALPAGPVPAGPRGPIARHGGRANPPEPHISIASELGDPEPLAYQRLAAWAQHWYRDDDEPIDEPADWLAAHLDRICDDGDRLPELARDLRAAVLALRLRACDARTIVGRCPTEDCDGLITADPHEQTATCTDCGATWDQNDWGWLADTLRPPQAA